MTPQEMFDTVVKHLFRQNRKAGSLDGTDMFMCAYRDDQGGKCAVGCLIPDELYDQEIEGRNVGYHGVHQIMEKCIDDYSDKHYRILVELQEMHDDYEVEEWRPMMRSIAKRHSLRWKYAK